MTKAACFLAALCVFLPLIPTATAIACPPDQVFSGTLLPGEKDTINVTTTVRGNTTFLFAPKRYDLVAVNQGFTMSVGGATLSCECYTAVTFANMAPGTRAVDLQGDHLVVADKLLIDGFVVTDYDLIVSQSNCS